QVLGAQIALPVLSCRFVSQFNDLVGTLAEMSHLITPFGRRRFRTVCIRQIQSDVPHPIFIRYRALSMMIGSVIGHSIAPPCPYLPADASGSTQYGAAHGYLGSDILFRTPFVMS